MLNQVKIPFEMPPPNHVYGHATIIWCVWALKKNLSNMFTMPSSVPTLQISATNTSASLNHLLKNLNSILVSLECHFKLYDNPFTLPLETFSNCKIPFWGSLDEPPRSEFEIFLTSLCYGETRGVTQGRIKSIIFHQFNTLHYLMENAL